MTDKALLQECYDQLRIMFNPDVPLMQKLTARLAQPEPEPVAWMHTSAAGNVYFRKKPHDKVFNPQPVYLTSSPREWVDLTHEEIIDCMDTPTWLGTLLAIQDKIKEKNI